MQIVGKSCEKSASLINSRAHKRNDRIKGLRFIQKNLHRLKEVNCELIYSNLIN